MNYFLRNYIDLNVSAEIAIPESMHEVKDFQVMMHITEGVLTFDEQLISMSIALKMLLEDDLLENAIPVSAQCFLSDSANQQESVEAIFSEILKCSICLVKQPPLDGTKLALWIQLQTNLVQGNDGLRFYEHNGYSQYFGVYHCDSKIQEKESSYDQTLQLLETYEQQLRERGCSIENDCLRTWFFVRDVDLNYQGVVDARKENFRKNGLNELTHYIASTGIEGSVADPRMKVLLNTFAIKGLERAQIKFLYAKTHLSATIDYGVTFERGVMVDFGDQRKVYISGTASIDNKGQVVHDGDIEKQVYRMWENVEALLAEADCGFADVSQAVVYLRDIADYKCVSSMFNDKFKGLPYIIVLAPICRTGWLVEMECIALKARENTAFRPL